MKTKVLWLILFAFSILQSCNSTLEKSHDNEQVHAIALSEPPPLRESEGDASSSMTHYDVAKLESDIPSSGKIEKNSKDSVKKIIKDGNISVKTDDINISKKNIDDVLKTLNAYYEIEDLKNDDQTVSYHLKIRVPSYDFEKLIASIENGKDEIKSKSIQARDVTEEFLDIETRLENKREYLKRYKELLSKASTVKDILDIEDNIRTLQEEIESTEGRLKYLNDQISFSTLVIDLYKEKEFVYKSIPEDKFSERLKTSFNNGWKSVVHFILWIFSIWPFIIFGFVVFFIIRRILKKRKIKKSE